MTLLTTKYSYARSTGNVPEPDAMICAGAGSDASIGGIRA